MAESEEPPATGRWRLGRAARWWAAAGAFVVGLLVGGVLVGFAAGGSAPLPQGTTARRTPSAGAPGTPTPTPAGATGQVAVNQACLRALNAAQDIYGTLDDLGNAARQFNAARLDEVIQQLEPLQARLRQNLGDCDVSARLPGGLVGGSSSAAPSAGSASPTS